MRIIAGEYGGRLIEQPATRSVRPMSEKVRGALFDVVGELSGAIVLDAYAGSGAIGFEALSRGAAMVEAIEENPRVARTIEANMDKLGLSWGYILTTLKVETWLALPANREIDQRTIKRYNLIVADPPYAQLEDDVLDRLAGFLVPDGVLVVSHGSKRPSPALESIELVQHKVYGDSALSFYKS